jgi:hypothetical protein
LGGEAQASSEEPGAAAGSEPGGEEADDTPAEKKDEKGKVTHRKYLIFRPVGQGKFEQVTWYEDADGRIVPKGTEGSKKKSSCLVRGKDDALATGYMAIGAPPEGAELIAVTANYWVAKTVKPQPVQPTRSRLQIG